LRIDWIGHSTVLVELDGVSILTDPLLRPRIAHVRRVIEAPARIDAELDAILISHVHHDHLDLGSLRLVRARQIVVPRGGARLVEGLGFDAVVELDEGAELAIGSVTIGATHAEHPSRRWPWRDPVPAVGYVLRGSASVYFAGDTDVFEGMAELGRGLDVALLPIDGWGPRVGPGHLDPRRAAEALRLLTPGIAIPIHWGTYRRIGLHGDLAELRERAERFKEIAGELAPGVEVRILAPGEHLELPVAAASGRAR
jgi:L-ascorbate metabolism protein UlaG (beta-lactamase superfamily)